MLETCIVVKNLSKSFFPFHMLYGIKSLIFNLNLIRLARQSKFQALKNITFSVQRGESVGIVGKNGSGKSTLLYLIAGILKPTSGYIEVKGRISPLLELGTGFHPDFNAVDNIVLNATLLGLSLKEARNKVDSILEFAELERFKDVPLRAFSSGMVARLAFAVAIHLSPDILLIDEILSVGDASFQEKSKKAILSLRDRGVTIVFVSHSESDVKLLCDRALLLHHGELVYDGDVDSVFKEYRKLS